MSDKPEKKIAKPFKERKPADLNKKIMHFQSMLAQGEEEKRKLLKSLTDIDNFLIGTRNALIALELYKIGISPHDAWKMKQEGKSVEQFLKDRKKTIGR